HQPCGGHFARLGPGTHTAARIDTAGTGGERRGRTEGTRSGELCDTCAARCDCAGALGETRSARTGLNATACFPGAGTPGGAFGPCG
ncbi:MAG TPA: hypothetical protein VKB20_06595, partial [Steroidobacteraceae bacterium]|nr:hypothetical protein [Steroidobacteraceae bacterium]